MPQTNVNRSEGTAHEQRNPDQVAQEINQTQIRTVLDSIEENDRKRLFSVCGHSMPDSFLEYAGTLFEKVSVARLAQMNENTDRSKQRNVQNTRSSVSTKF